MKKIFFIVMISAAAASASATVSDPLQYPDRNTVSSQKAFFFWQDLSGEEMQQSLFRVTLSRDGKADSVFEAKPSVYKGFFYIIAPFPLAKGDYSYGISPLYDGKPDTVKYFGFRRYPLKGAFTSDPGEAPLDIMAAIDYMSASRENRRSNGLNALFFGGGAAVCGGIAALFFSVLDFNIWTKIAGAAFTAGSATGIFASSWYGYKYLSTQHDLDTKNRSLKERGIQLSFSSAL